MFTTAVAFWLTPPTTSTLCEYVFCVAQPHLAAADSGATTFNPKNQGMTHRPEGQILPSFEDPKLQLKIAAQNSVATDAAEIAADSIQHET